ncbi:hypothetical protein GOM44_06805, partial [Wolbachia endosymbiont of Atemnus politus]|uniref:ankyrin repeat domain-containing protein n=1 Tax=Wolbachia endosymbiont of Atemnus politus TaxID=2682840 RepID=UPI001574659D
RILLKKITNSESFDEIKEVANVFSNVKLDQMISDNFKMREHEKLEELVKELSDNITDKTNYEKELFNKMNDIINLAKTKSENIRTDYIKGFVSLKSLSFGLNDNKIDHNVIRGIKFFANKTLESMVPQIESHSLKEIAKLSMKISCIVTSRIQHNFDEINRSICEISHSVMSRIQHNFDEINRSICEIFYIAEFGTGDIKWIEGLREKLNEKGSFIPTHKQMKTYTTEEKYNNQLALKLSELKSILSNNLLNGQSIEKFPFYKSDKELKAVVEMLVLDIMSILGSSKHYLENNLLFLDDNTPLLTGKCLRNHLAHDNALVDVLLSDPSIALILNAKKLTEENIMKSKKKIGKLVSDDPFKVREKYNKVLVTITNQERMFVALAEGNLESLKDCLKKGADIKARSVNLWTTLHFAAKGPSLEIIKFVLDHNLGVNVKDINGQSPLHIAAAHGRKNIVRFFVEEMGLYVDDLDNHGKTPLHIAAQNGHKDTVEVLLKNKASTVTQDIGVLSPVYYAIGNNHVDVAMVLLEKDTNVDINEAMGGYTPLHKAAESGHLELVNFLLQNKADVNARNDINWTPLHA